MGSWGIRAHESDCGLDLHAVAEDRYLRGVKFKTYHVRHIIELLRTHIIDSFAKESYGWEAEYIDFFYEYTLPYNFAHAVILVAECFAEYRQNGKLVVFDYKPKRRTKKVITDFIFTNKDLQTLTNELLSILDPKHGLYESWKDSEKFNEWKLHIQTLCETLTNAINEGGGDCE